MGKLAKYYFGPDFWYVLATRLVCILWWVLFGLGASQAEEHNRGQQESPDGLLAGNGDPGVRSIIKSAKQLNRRLKSFLPISQTTFLKVLLVLAYAQMLVQQMENKENLQSWDHASLLLANSEAQHTGSCAGSSGGDSAHCLQGAQQAAGSTGGGALDFAMQWLSCVWSSAHTCSAVSQPDSSATRASRLFDFLSSVWVSALSALAAAPFSFYHTLASLHFVWLSRWRSPIIQRLMQSMLVHLYYIGSLVLGGGADEDQD